MAARKYLHSITLTRGIVVGSVFEPIEFDDLPPLQIGGAIAGGHDDGSVLYEDTDGNLAQAGAGEFIWDGPGALTGFGGLFIAARSMQYGSLGLWNPDVGRYYIFTTGDASGGIGVIEQTTGNRVNFRVGSLTSTSFIINSGPADIANTGGLISAGSTQTNDLFTIADHAVATLSRFNKAGFFMTRKVAAPADADLASSELAIWLDATPGATKAMFKAKDSGGTVRTGSVALT